MSFEQPNRESLPDLMPMKPAQREDVPSLDDTEFARLNTLVEEFSSFDDTDPRYKEWENLQKRANRDMDQMAQ